MIDDATAPPLASLVESGPVPEPKSALKHLRDSAKKARANTTQDVRLPGYDGLYVTFRVLTDYHEVRDTLTEVLKKRGLSAGDREIAVAVRTLVLASVDSYALVDGERTNIGLPLGRGLYDEIWPAETEDEIRPDNDDQAVLWLFDNNTVQVTTLAGRLDLWFKNTNLRIDEDLLGE